MNFGPGTGRPLRFGFVVSHPIQYYAPLYQHLASRGDLSVRVFFTWHDGSREVHDPGFERPVAWDVPLTTGFDYELVRNVSSDPGTHHFLGLQNPSLLRQVRAWRPDVVHMTGWAWWSHFRLMHTLHLLGIPSLFRGDSHLLDGAGGGPRSLLKRLVLRRVFSWPSAFLVVGKANRDYFRSFGVSDDRLRRCPHSIDVRRFAEPSADLEFEAKSWRVGLGLAEDQRVLLFAGKFERKKQPLELARAFLELGDPQLVLLMVGGGELEAPLRELAAAAPAHIRLLPFQNQSRMPIVYRLGSLFILPSAYGETWGMAVNEALACGRPVLVRDRVGCASDVVDESCGAVFDWRDLKQGMIRAQELMASRVRLDTLGRAATERAWRFDTSEAERLTLELAREVAER